MRNRFFLIALFCLMGIGVAALLNLRFEKGDMFPEFSSIRADPLGTRVLFESLQRMGGVSVRRNFIRPEDLRCSGSAVIFAGLSPDALDDSAFSKALLALASRGNRVIVALRRETAFDCRCADGAETGGRGSVLGLRCVKGEKNDSESVSRVGTGLALRWPGALQFVADRSWRRIATRGTNMLLGEKRVEGGVILALHSSYHLSNQGLRENAQSVGSNPLAVFLVGPSRRIIFDEWHFGIAHADALVDVLTHFGLTGAVFFTGAWFMLFIWAARGDAAQRGRADASPQKDGAPSEEGIHQLLTAFVPAENLISVCKEEWKIAFPRRQLHGTQESTIVGTYNSFCKKMHGNDSPHQNGR